ncbi:MAG: DNA-3-methyladenine glycosylase [Candidatus Nanoarchaeia archaeon]
MPLQRNFYARDTALVARDLLGKILVHRSKTGLLKGKIVETEAYYGSKDPASRAFGKSLENAGMSAQMFKLVGTSFVYMVHNNWLFNIVARDLNTDAGAVLIRALEPVLGIEQMFKNRGLDPKVNRIKDLCSGPGKLTKAFGIEKKHSGLDLTIGKDIWIDIEERKEKFEIESSNRIGVSKDLPEKLRFYIKNNPFVSKNIKKSSFE